MLEAALVEALACHVEVLHLELLDALTQDTIHFAHVDELVVDFVDATCPILVALGSIPHCIRLLGLLSTLVMLCFASNCRRKGEPRKPLGWEVAAAWKSCILQHLP